MISRIRCQISKILEVDGARIMETAEQSDGADGVTDAAQL